MIKLYYKTKRIVISALFAALIFVGTFFIKIPTPPVGYINLGDPLVLTAAVLLPFPYSFLTAAIGSCFADFISGYGIYIPATFIIKGLMTVIISFMPKKCPRTVSFIIAELLMVLGYFGFEALIIGLGIGAAVSILPNLVQGLAGVIFALLLTAIINKNKLLSNFFHS